MQAEKIIKHNIEILPISTKQIEEVWGLVHFMIAEAIQYSGNYAEAKHIKELLLTGENQLFLIFGSEEDGVNKVFGVCTTRIFENPNFSELQGLICTGTKMHLWEDKLISMLETFAKLNGCKRITALMRPGYKKVMPKYGYTMKHIQFQKELN
jgi:hypothetical protein